MSGKRGRKLGSRNAPGSRKPGPKPGPRPRNAQQTAQQTPVAAPPQLNPPNSVPLNGATATEMPPQLSIENSPAPRANSQPHSVPASVPPNTSVRDFWTNWTRDVWERAILDMVIAKQRNSRNTQFTDSAMVPKDIQTRIWNSNLPWIEAPCPFDVLEPLVRKCFVKRTFVFIPELLYPYLFSGEKSHPSCPDCKSNKVRAHAYIWRDAIDEHDNVRVLGRRYICIECSAKVKLLRAKKKANGAATPFSSEQRDPNNIEAPAVDGTFQCWDKDVLMALPSYVQSEFPYLFTHRSGIAKTTVACIVDDVLNGKGFKSSREAIEQRFLSRFKELERSFIAHREHHYEHQKNAAFRVSNQLPSDPKPLGVFSDPKKYGGFVPSEDYVVSVFYKYFEAPVFHTSSIPMSLPSMLREDASKLNREFYIQRRLQMLDGNIWSMDATYKVANLVLIRNSDGSSTHPINSIFVIMNQYEQVIFIKALITNSPDELKTHMEKILLHRYRARKFKFPILIHTDNCCNDRDMVHQVLQSLSDSDSMFTTQLADASPNTIQPLPDMELPDTQLVHHVTKYKLDGNDDGLKIICEVLRRNAGKNGAISLDIEYNVSYLSGQKSNPPATLQLGTATGHSYVFSLFQNGKKIQALPKELKELLYDTQLVFVGNFIQADLTRLSKHYSLDQHKVHEVDLAQLAMSRGVLLPEKGLAFLCRLFLNKHLGKGSVRISNWEGSLSQEQIHYAALDTVCAAQIYESIMSFENPRFARPPSLDELSDGTILLLFPPYGPDYVAKGSVVTIDGDSWGGRKLQTKTETRVVVTLTSGLSLGAQCFYSKNGDDSERNYSLGDNVLWNLKHTRLETPETLEWYRQKDKLENTLPSSRPSTTISATGFTTPSDADHFFPPLALTADTLAALDVNTLQAPQYGNQPGEEYDDVDMDVDDESNCCSRVENPELAATEGEHVHVRLDIFHAMQRLSRTMLKSHGAYHAFLARLQDAFLIVCSEDIEQISACLKSAGKTDTDIQEMKEKDWSFFVANSRRVCPPKDILLVRFNWVVAAFSDVQDAKTGDIDFHSKLNLVLIYHTGELLFRPPTRKQINNLRKHIVNGCISDVPDIPLYFAAGRSKEGFTKYRCCRGTNSNEGFHRHLRVVLHMYSGSPYLLHLVLLEYVYRWNLRMAIKNRGLDPEIGGFYNQHVLEEINFMTEPHVDVVPYAAWGSILDYEDNGERMGLRRTVFGGTPESSEFNGGIQEAEFDLPADQPDFNLTQSATMYAKLQDLRTPVASIATDEERAKFWELLPRFLAPARDIDASFSEFAEEWNRIISNPDTGISVKNLRCKTAAQLKSFYKTVLAGFN
ncbi:hypothetical protein HDU77_005788, partial [Chytriomyces hyalinus]